jgi:hypothetical protein
MDYPREEDAPYRIWVQKVKGQAHWPLEHYPFHLESSYRTNGLPMGGRYRIWESEGQRSSALDIKVEIQFLGSGMLPFPPRVTISHIWTTHRRKIFGVKRSRVKCTGHQSRNMVSGLKNVTLPT